MINPCNRFRSILLIAVLQTTFFIHEAVAATWYVDAAATGEANGTSHANAWNSFGEIKQSSLSGGDIVLVYGGTYNERFMLSKGGTSLSSRITYKGINLPVLRGVDGGSIGYIALIGFQITQLSSLNNYAAIYLYGANGWLIQDNYIHDTYGFGLDAHYGSHNNNCIVRCNTFSNVGSVGGGSGSGANIIFNGNGTLIEYNTTENGLDRCRAYGTGIVIRNNYWGSTDTAFYPSTNPYPFHSDGFQSDNGSPLMLAQLLYERNWDTDNKDSIGGTNAHGIILQDPGSDNLNWVIERFTVLVRPGGGAVNLGNIKNTFFYNQTYIGINNGTTHIYQAGVAFPAGYPVGQKSDWRNITWSYCPTDLSPNGVIDTDRRPTSFTSDYQHSFNPFGGQPVLSSGIHNLAHSNPLFTSETLDEYTLQWNSPLRGAGGPITTASGAGANSITLAVSDAHAICDGWDIVDADFIQIGSNSYVQVRSINYASNVITLSEPCSWKIGDPVMVKGMEDIGALPYYFATPYNVTNTTPLALAAGTTNLTATVDFPDAVRKIEFLVDGIPVGASYAAPYEVSWTCDGESHQIEARAYSAWASKTPFTSKILTINSGT